MKYAIGLIGLGVVGAPIAEKLYEWDKEKFVLIADPVRKKMLRGQGIKFRGKPFCPTIISERSEKDTPLGLIIVCVKNFHLAEAITTIKSVIAPETVLLPLENGITAYKLFCETFRENVVLEGFCIGANTERLAEGFVYNNPGRIHMGTSQIECRDKAIEMYMLLKTAGIDVVYETEIKNMVWKKWMLNVAGNTVTAILGANYSDFCNSEDLREICRVIMREFVLIANAEHIYLDETDIESVIRYYVGYKGKKVSSMLEDVTNKRMTENEYIVGEALRMARKHGLSVPSIETMYMLVKAKESLYLGEKR